MRKFFFISMTMSLGLIHCSDDPPKNNGNQNSGPSAYVGDPCVPTNESDALFSGFQMTGEAIEISAPACGGGVCLINHFQGRASCPLGQAPPQPCLGPDDKTTCGSEASCVPSAVVSPTCDPNMPDQGASHCAGFGGVCDSSISRCICSNTLDCPAFSYCDLSGGDVGVPICRVYVCHKAGNCQSANASASENQGKACCVPETELPVTSPVCGQCASNSGRAGDDAVYCSCRCGSAEGQAPGPDDVFCKCPTGFECSEVRKYIGIGDPKLTGKYCIKQGTAYTSEVSCGQVEGYFNSTQCQGIGQ